MGDTNGRKIAHFLKRITWHRKKSSERHENAIDWYILVLRKEAKFGAEDKWVIRTKEKAIARLKAFGIPATKVKEVLEARGHKDLLSKVVY
jgi:hypothetical protein